MTTLPVAPRDMLNTDELATHIRIPADTIKHWRYRRKGPEWFKLGHRVFYDVRDVDAWIEQRRELNRRGAA